MLMCKRAFETDTDFFAESKGGEEQGVPLSSH